MESSMRLPAATKRGATPPEAAALVQKLVEDQVRSENDLLSLHLQKKRR